MYIQYNNPINDRAQITRGTMIVIYSGGRPNVYVSRDIRFKVKLIKKRWKLVINQVCLPIMK